MLREQFAIEHEMSHGTAARVVFFGLFQRLGDYRLTLLWAGYLFLPAALFALLLP
jgi:hypothetical protein